MKIPSAPTFFMKAESTVTPKVRMPICSEGERKRFRKKRRNPLRMPELPIARPSTSVEAIRMMTGLE